MSRKSWRYLASALALLLIVSACYSKVNDGHYVNDEVGGQLYDLNGNKLSFSQFRGKWIVVNYWAPWCGPCREEIPELNKFHLNHQNSDAVVIGVDFDPITDAQRRAQVASLNIKFPVVNLNPANKLGIEPIRVIPTTILVDPKGRVVRTLLGAQSKRHLERVMKIS